MPLLDHHLLEDSLLGDTALLGEHLAQGGETPGLDRPRAHHVGTDALGAPGLGDPFGVGRDRGLER